MNSFSPGYYNSGSGLKQLLKAISVFLFKTSSERMHLHYSPFCSELQIVVLAEACTGPTDTVLCSEAPPASVAAILSYTGTGGGKGGIAKTTQKDLAF